MIHEFNPQIYPRLLWVCFKATRKELEDKFNFTGPIEDYWYKEGVTTSKCTNKETGLGGILVWTGKTKISTNYISHEAVHVASMIFEYIGEEQKTDECFAYLVGWVAECIEKAMKNFKNK